MKSALSVLLTALAMKTLTHPFFIEMEKGARRAEAEMRVNLQVRTAAQETSIEQQIQIVNDLIAVHVDAIVIAPGGFGQPDTGVAKGLGRGHQAGEAAVCRQRLGGAGRLEVLA
jgi:ribose transport system substrate-binding protein